LLWTGQREVVGVELVASFYPSSRSLNIQILCSGIASTNATICCQNAARTYPSAREVCYRCDCKYVFHNTSPFYFSRLSKDQAPKDHATLRALTALIASLPATENKAFREEFETVHFSFTTFSTIFNRTNVS
jgi:hypothetical protein